MIEYNKIDTVFERDTDGSKKLIEGRFRSDAVELLKDAEWQFTEKIDGTNIRIHWDGHMISFAGRTDRANIPAPLFETLVKMFHNENTEQLFEQMFGEKEVILFGEGYGPKIQNGGNYRSDVSFILFDVWINGKYLERKDVLTIGVALGVEVVPTIFFGTIQQAVDFVKSKPKSRFGTADMEGLVGKPAVELMDGNGKRLIVKIKVRDFE